MKMFLVYQQQVSLEVEALCNEFRLLNQKKAKLRSKVEKPQNAHSHLK